MNVDSFKKYIWILPLFSLILFACAKDYITGEKTFNLYGLSTDIKLGQEVMQQSLVDFKKKKVNLDKEADAKAFVLLRTIARRIQQVSHIPDFPYELHLANAPIANAWCAPGGKIMFYTGLWDKKKGLVEAGNRNELAAVMAHEIAHATARHVTESLSRAQTISAAGSVATSVIAGSGSPKGANLFEKVVVSGMNVYLPSYSRKSEAEADAIGIRYMAMAGYDPRAAVKLWERAAKKHGDKTSIFASHPSNGERAANLKKLLPNALKIYQAVGPAPKS